MKKITIFSIIIFSTFPAISQEPVLRLIDYRPAPGQHINIENIGTPESAQKMTENFNNLVSLGSFGGYVMLEFNEACINHPDNPFGIDFTIFGNAFSGSAEPGVVWIMQDQNQNGLPDDTWYEIAGSHYFHSKTLRKYEVKYFKTETRDVYWNSSTGKTGWILANSFNLQDYYPTEQFFPNYPSDSVTFTGTLLKTEIDSSNSQEIKVTPPVFGYADNHSRKQGVELFSPDNPYTKEIEGAGGDPIDISWAVDSLGNYVELDSIHFIKIVSGNLAGAGWLGEISTDVAWIEPVQPNPAISGKENILVVYPHPPKVLWGDTLQLEAVYFEKGKKVDAAINFTSQNEQVAEVYASGKLAAKSLGETEIFVSVGNERETMALAVVQPDSISVLTDFSAVYPGDTLELVAQVFDNLKEKLDVPVHVSVSEPNVGNIIQQGDKFYFVALQPGDVILTAAVDRFPAETSQTVKVHSPEDKIQIYFTLKTEEENLLPFQWIEVETRDLNGFVENRQKNYAMLERPTLFHALVAGLQKANVPFVFRDDDAAEGKLYLYSIENDGLFLYGWGGKSEPDAYSRAWIAQVSHEHILNDLDKTEISSGDTVALYHVSKINEPWIFTRILSSKDSALINDELEVYLEQAVCEYSEGKIIQSELLPVENAPVNAGEIYYTNEFGKAVFTLGWEPPLIITAGAEAVLISKKITTGTNLPEQNNFHIYPNPVKNELFVKGSFDSGRSNILQLASSGGQLIFEKEVFSNLEHIDFSSMPPGIYILKVIRNGKTETHKIIKK